MLVYVHITYTFSELKLRKKLPAAVLFADFYIQKSDSVR